MKQTLSVGFAVGLIMGLWGPTWGHCADGPSSTANRHQPEARVVITQDPDSIVTYNPQPEKIKLMVDRGILRLTGKPSITRAWLSLVSTQDTVGIKVFCNPGPAAGTRLPVVAAVVEGLLAAGLPPNHILVWDKNDYDLQLANYHQLTKRYGIRVAGAADAGYDDKVFYETPLIGNLVFGDHEFGKKGEGIGRKSFVSKLVTKEMTKIISISPMLNHNEAGVAGCLYSVAMGSIDNTIRFESEDRLSQAVPEIYALPILGDRVVLNIVDGLICQYEGEQRSLLHYSTMLKQIRFSKDPVALDVLSLQELDREREAVHAVKPKSHLELYQNASLLELGVSETKRIHIENAP